MSVVKTKDPAASQIFAALVQSLKSVSDLTSAIFCHFFAACIDINFFNLSEQFEEYFQKVHPLKGLNNITG